MSQKIKSLKLPTEELTDIDVIFVSMYSLILEKLESEPGKGIIVSKGNPNQRKISWKKLMKLCHELEDYFIFRGFHEKNTTCDSCCYWKSISEESPHMGFCKKTKSQPIHRWFSCKYHKEENT